MASGSHVMMDMKYTDQSDVGSSHWGIMVDGSKNDLNLQLLGAQADIAGPRSYKLHRCVICCVTRPYSYQAGLAGRKITCQRRGRAKAGPPFGTVSAVLDRQRPGAQQTSVSFCLGPCLGPQDQHEGSGFHFFLFLFSLVKSMVLGGHHSFCLFNTRV